MLESLQQFLMLKHSKLHTEHCGYGKTSVVRHHGSHLSDTLPHIGKLVHAVFQQCRWNIAVVLAGKCGLPLLLFHYKDLPQLFQHTVAVFQECWDMKSSPPSVHHTSSSGTRGTWNGCGGGGIMLMGQKCSGPDYLLSWHMHIWIIHITECL